MGDHNAPDAPSPIPSGVERLLAELSDLRLLLDSDLTIAAAALDADAPGVAFEVLSDEHERLNSLQARLLRGVAPASAEAVPAPDLNAELAAAHAVGVGAGARQERGALVPLPRRQGFARLPGGAAAALAAAAVVAAVLGGSAIPKSSDHHGQQAVASSVDLAFNSYGKFSQVATNESTDASDVQAAAAALHASIMPLINAAATSPESAHQALELLLSEQALLLQSKPAGAQAILREAHRLVLRLRTLAPASVPPAAAKPLPAPEPAPSSKASPKPSPSPTKSPSPSATPSPKPSPKPSSKPSSSPSPSPSSSPSGIIPGF